MNETPDEQWDIETDGKGCCFTIRVSAGANRNQVRGIHQGALKVSVTQIAEKGKANREVLKLLSKTIGLKRSELMLKSGETSRLKKIYCSGISIEELRCKLNRLK